VRFLNMKIRGKEQTKLNKVYRHWWQWLMNEP